MRNFQSIFFIWTQTYTEIFKFALVYLQIYICVLLIYFLCMFFSSVKEIKRLISKGISSIYSKITIEKNWLQSLKKFSPGQVLGSSNSVSIIEFWHFFLQLKNQRSGSKSLRGFSVNLVLKWTVKVWIKESTLLFKKINLSKSETELKM